MRGKDENSGALFRYGDLGSLVPKGPPQRRIQRIVNAALEDMRAFFETFFTRMSRPSNAPEKLLRALLLQAFYSTRSERRFMERLDFDLPFRCFVGQGIDDPVWDHSTFSKNRDRLLDGDIAVEFLAAVLNQPQLKRPWSSDHFSVDGTMIKAVARMKSFQPKGGDGPPDEGGERIAQADFKSEEATLKDKPWRLVNSLPGENSHGRVHSSKTMSKVTVSLY